MGKILIITLSVILFIGCTRAKNNETTKLQVQLPSASKAPATSSKKVGALGGTSPEPTGFSGAAPVNCYMVAAGGPEESMSKNKCFSRNNVNTSLGERKVGLFVGAAPAGGTVTIDVPSGSNRSVYVVGFHAPDLTYCRSFKDYGFPEGTLSHPYLLGEKTGLEMKAGETMDLPINVAFDSNNVIDCEGPDFPANGGGGSTPSMEATNIAAEFYQLIGSNQCHPMRVHLYAEVGGVDYYYTHQSVTHTIGLPYDVSMNLSYYSSEADCSSSTNSFTSIQIAPTEHEKIVWFKAQNGSSGYVNLNFSSSTGLLWTQQRPINVTYYPGSFHGWQANSVDYIEPTRCHDLYVNAVDSSGTTTAATDSSATIAILDMLGSPLTSSGITLVDNCTSQTPIDPNNVPIMGTKLRVNFGLKMPSAPITNFKVVVSSLSSMQSSETVFNPAAVINSLRMTLQNPLGWNPTGLNTAYAGDCLPATYEAIDTNGNPMAVPFDIPFYFYSLNNEVRTYTSGSCSMTDNLPKFMQGNTSYNNLVRFNAPAGTYTFDVHSSFINHPLTQTVNILNTPAFMPGAKIHAVAGNIMQAAPTYWQSSSTDGNYLELWSLVGSIVASSDPIVNHQTGIYLNGGSGKYLDYYGTLNTGATVSIRFKPDGGTVGNLIETKNISETLTNNVNLGADGKFYINATDTGITWSGGNWYNVSFVHDGLTSCTLYVQTNGGTIESAPIACTSFSSDPTGRVLVSGGTAGYIKSAMLFTQVQLSSDVQQVFDYLNNRFP